MLKVIGKAFLYFIVFVLFSFFFWMSYLLKSGSHATILMYHSVDEKTADKTTLSVSEATFEKQMRFLSEHRYHVIPLMDLAERLKKREKIPPKTVVLTFDDGYENNYTKAFPILQKYQYPATIFLIIDYLGKEKDFYGHRFRFMSVDMVRKMENSGLITFGSHTFDHECLPGIKDAKVLNDEIAGSKIALEKILNKPVYAFCYPKGGYTRDIQGLVRKAGYSVAVTTLPRKGPVCDDLFALKRVKMTESSKNLFIFFVETSGYFLKMKEMSK